MRCKPSFPLPILGRFLFFSSQRDVRESLFFSMVTSFVLSFFHLLLLSMIAFPPFFWKIEIFIPPRTRNDRRPSGLSLDMPSPPPLQKIELGFPPRSNLLFWERLLPF